MTAEKNKKVWLITGVSGGFGKEIAMEAAKRGDIVYGTLRKINQFPAFEALVPGNTIPLLMDVTHHDEVEDGVAKILEEQGRIDVLVNNAGYGLFGAIEEVSMEEARNQMETNFFGPLALCKAVLPAMRNQKSGRILQISSMAGMTTAPGVGIYNASKHALEGFSGALAQEVAEFNIRVTLIEPGPFRTEWAGDSSVDAKIIIPDYDNTAGTTRKNIHGYSGSQPGDPHKAALAMLKVVDSNNPPLRLPLGAVAYQRMRIHLANVAKEVDSWESIGMDTDFREEVK